MQLVRKTRKEKNKNGNKIRYAIFKCLECLQEVERQMSNGLKAKSCGNHQHGESNTKLYGVWRNMKNRILNPNHKQYKDYGGRGITICPEWTNDYITFRDWALSNGYKEGLIFDRENPDGNYEPSNCRFLTIEESNRNTRKTITMEIANEIRYLWKTGNCTQKELSIKFNVSHQTISLIINNKNWRLA